MSPSDRDPDATQAYTPIFHERPPDEAAPAPTETPDWPAESLLPFAPRASAGGAEEPPRARTGAGRNASAPDDATALELLFAEERFEEMPDGPTVLRGRTRRTAAKAAPGPPQEAPSAAAMERRRALLAAGAASVGVLVLVALFALGTRLPAMFDGPSPVEVTAVPLPSDAAVGPVEPGVWAWNELRGGECLEPYTGAWAQEFTVVPCDLPHTGQLVVRGSYAAAAEEGEVPTPDGFPGADELAAGIGELCAEAGRIDYAAARSITDGQLEGSFPVTEAQWEEDRSYYCFFSRSSGASFTGSVIP